MNIQNLYQDYLKDIKLMQLATCRDNQPWLCNVWYVMDEKGKIYWLSRETRRHSQDIQENPHISCIFHKWFDGGLGQKGQALIVAGKAKQLSPKECQKPYELYLERYPKLSEFQSLDTTLNGSGNHKFYEINPTEIVWWDEENFPTDPRQQIL